MESRLFGGSLGQRASRPLLAGESRSVATAYSTVTAQLAAGLLHVATPWPTPSTTTPLTLTVYFFNETLRLWLSYERPSDW